MYTIDCSVWVSAFDPRRPNHVICRTLLDQLEALHVPIYVPNLLLAEIASTISRGRNETIHGRIFASQVRSIPTIHFIPLDDVLAQYTAEIATDLRLRAADALYVAVALQASATLVTLDNEQRTRAADVLTAHTPEQALADVTA